MTDSAADRLRLAALAVLLLVAISSPQHYRDDMHTANESVRIYAAQAIARHGTIDLAPVFETYFAGWRERHAPPNVDVSVRDGAYVLDKAPGISLAAVPVVWLLDAAGVGYGWQAWVLSLLLSALPSVGFVVLFARWGAPWPLAAASVLATPWLVYANLFFGHAAAAAALGAGLLLALGPLDHHAGDDRRAPMIGGGLLGLAVLAEYTTIPLVVTVLVALLVDPARRRRLGPVIAGGLAPAVVLAIWNTLAFGAPWRLSYGYKADAAMAATHARGLFGVARPTSEGLFGILLSGSRGLLYFAPWLALGVAGALLTFAPGQRVARAWRVVLPTGIALFVAMIGGFGDWHGGLGYGPRYLVPLIPLLAIGAVVGIRSLAGRRYGAATLAGLVAGSAALALLGAYVDVYCANRIANPAFEVNLPVLLAAGPAPTVWSSFLPRSAGLLIGGLALACALAGRWRRPRREHALAIATGIAVMLVHIAVAMQPATRGDDAAQRIVRARMLAHQRLLQPAAAARLDGLLQPR